MSRALIPLALFATGCVPVTVPIGDIEKAPPDKLVGTWRESDSVTWIVDRPEVKGNPKGLMRVRWYDSPENLKKGEPRDTIWFFAATVGKITYANALIESGRGYAELSTEGAYARWKKDPRYWLALLGVGADEARVYVPDRKAFEALMEENKVTADKFSYYTLRPGELEKILEKAIGADALTDSPNKLTRVKGK